MKHLSYETLYNLIDTLNKEINKEEKATDLFNMEDTRLTKLQNDKKIVRQAIAEKNKFFTRLAKETKAVWKKYINY